jgi:hypothetical protein
MEIYPDLVDCSGSVYSSAITTNNIKLGNNGSINESDIKLTHSGDHHEDGFNTIDIISGESDNTISLNKIVKTYIYNEDEGEIYEGEPVLMNQVKISDSDIRFSKRNNVDSNSNLNEYLKLYWTDESRGSLYMKGGVLSVQNDNDPYKCFITTSEGITVVNSSGSGQATLTSSGVNTSSDIRLKSNIETLQDRGQLNPVSFEMDGKKMIGFVAQEVQELYPEVISEDNTDDHYLSINYPMLVAALQAQINSLNERIKILENK